MRSRRPATRQMTTCGLWRLSPSAWPTGSDPIPGISRTTPFRRFIACANADQDSVLGLSMVLLPVRWGSRIHRRFVWLQMFKLERGAMRVTIEAPRHSVGHVILETITFARRQIPVAAGHEANCNGMVGADGSAGIRMVLVVLWASILFGGKAFDPVSPIPLLDLPSAPLLAPDVVGARDRIFGRSSLRLESR